MTNATDSSAHSPRARRGPHLRLGPDKIAAVMVAAPTVLVMMRAVWIIVTGWAAPGSLFYELSFAELFWGSLILLLAVGIARHARAAQVLGVVLCAPTSLWFLSMAGESSFTEIGLGVGGYTGVVAILLLVALLQKPNPGG